MGSEMSTPAPQGGEGGEVQQQQQQQQAPNDAIAQQQQMPLHPQSGLPSALVIVGPSGVGKNTLIQRLREGNTSFGHSVSHTTRQPRPGEKHGEHYFFTSKEQFAKEIAEDKFIEFAEVHGNLYGTSVTAVRKVLESGRTCILDIDVQGARLVRKTPLKAIFVFIAPPSLEDLAKRLFTRGTEAAEQIQKRLANAKEEINSVNERGLYDYLIINDNLDDAVDKLRAIATRALQGLDPEPGKVPESVLIEDAPLPGMPPLDPTAPQENGAQGLLLSEDPPGAASAAADPLPNPTAAAPPSTTANSASDKEAQPAVTSNGGTGMRVVAVARRKEKLEALQVHMHNLRIPPTHFLPVVCDITKDAEVATLPRIVAKRWPDAGGVDVLINNAGLSRNDASLMDGNVASWVEMLSTNVLGTTMAIKAAVQDMRRRNKWGHIINMVGLSGHRIPDGPQGGGFYCATKSAVKTITDGLRQEARGKMLPLRVSSISPGVVETEFFTVKNFGDAEAARSTIQNYASCLQPQDVAQTILWCLSAPDHVEVNDVVVRPTDQLL
ncbi:P-loop containing nucleoside triphosphate hydrolase protein [Dunaliella salina]|uniref:guanylate kinase n=1 Tax=Dunaliella salina TaxID=3046 RepID=A0ABQ7H4B6_DUNSA|nr:P-loop containing nucleoside triphosphate hydrolase protein [Dunaliella salina]|eukprot:KAF5841702.1 P-loop containing nucleoside triphosphate hydrolase protein [Dunaliella salina]